MGRLVCLSSEDRSISHVYGHVAWPSIDVDAEVQVERIVYRSTLVVNGVLLEGNVSEVQNQV